MEAQIIKEMMFEPEYTGHGFAQIVHLPQKARKTASFPTDLFNIWVLSDQKFHLEDWNSLKHASL